MSSESGLEQGAAGSETAQAAPRAQPGQVGQSRQSKRKPMNPRVKRGLVIAGVVALAIGVIYGLIWLLHGRFIVSTDDAYLRADSVTIAPRVSGYIDEIYVKENQRVTAGQALLHIDKRSYQDTLAQQGASLSARMADVEAAESQMHQQDAVIAQGRAQLRSAVSKAEFSRSQEQRYRLLRDQGADTEEKFAQARNESAQDAAAESAAIASLRAAQSQLGVLESQRAQARAQLESARAAVSTAKQNLDDTVIRAGVAGTVGDDSARVGQFVQPGTRLMSVVPVESVYLVANFKETQIRHMRIGQKAKVKVDAISGAEIEAQVESFAPGTGSQFALLPPENATGNFIKIVQRVPVRLKVMPPKDLADRLLPGLSVTVDVDTGDRGRQEPTPQGVPSRQGAAGGRQGGTGPGAAGGGSTS